MLSRFADIDRQALQQLWHSEGIQSNVGPLVENYWQPLAEAIASKQTSSERPHIQGILGGQGTGKTTLCLMLQAILEQWGIKAASLSIDDIYKTYRERQSLRQRDPRLRWRGPPGTHDVDLGLTVIQQVRQRAQTVELPQFDKYAYDGQGDRTAPRSINPVDVLFLEGWFVGTRPVYPGVFENSPEPIVTDDDRHFALDINESLKQYVPLWDCLDSLFVLNPVDYRLSLDWRWEAEQKAIAHGKTGMSRAEITEFVQYFWKALHPELFITPLTQSSQWTDFIIEIGADHAPTRLHSPD